MCRYTYDSCACISGITYNSWKFWKNCTSITPFLGRMKTWNMSPKKTRNTLSCSLLMYVPQKFAADAEYAPQAAARGFQSACFLSDLPKPLSRTASWVLCNQLGARHPLNPVIEGYSTPKKERKKLASNIPESNWTVSWVLRGYRMYTIRLAQWWVFAAQEDKKLSAHHCDPRSPVTTRSWVYTT